MSNKEVKYPNPPDIEKPLDIPFKEFMPGQVISSTQFNDDMMDVEDKVNEVITKHNAVELRLSEHQRNQNNPHSVTPEQIGTYDSDTIDGFVEDVKNGNLHDESVTNRILGTGSVNTRVLMDNSVTNAKLDPDVGSQIDISKNISITDRYTKQETDAIIQEKVGDGTYSKEQIDAKFEEYQAGQIVDGTIDINKLKDNVGRQLDISQNPSITNRYTKTEVDTLIYKNGLPKDWGGLNDPVNGDESTVTPSLLGHLPITDVMVCGEFKASETDVLNIKVQEIEHAKGDFSTLELRLDDVDNKIEANKVEASEDRKSLWQKIRELTDGAMLLEGNGYIKFPTAFGGFIVQWGAFKGTTNDSGYLTKNVILPISMVREIRAFGNYGTANNQQPYKGSMHVAHISLSEIFVGISDAVPNREYEVRWLAVGY